MDFDTAYRLKKSESWKTSKPKQHQNNVWALI